MTTEQKAAAFDKLAVALTNQWWNGKWSWWNCSPCGGPERDTRDEAVMDLVEWAERTEKRKRKAGVPK